MAIRDFFANIFRVSDYDEEIEQNTLETPGQDNEIARPEPVVQPTSVARPPRPVGTNPQANPVRYREGNSMANITIVEPRVYGEVEAMAQVLIGNSALIINFRRMDQATATRVIDYLTGIVFAVKGNVQKLSNELFLFSPSNFQIEGLLDGDESDQTTARLDLFDGM